MRNLVIELCRVVVKSLVTWPVTEKGMGNNMKRLGTFEICRFFYPLFPIEHKIYTTLPKYSYLQRNNM